MMQGKTQKQFWDDEHISKNMLEAHLDPNLEAASRKVETIDGTINLITNLTEPCSYIDYGCGPGLYTSRLAGLGFDVTGVDYSKRSTKYAKSYAVEHGLSIDYIYQDYLNLQLDKAFDFASIIYCDFGVLNEKDRSKFLDTVHFHLNDEGLFLMDVWTPKHSYNQKVFKNFNIHTDASFFTEKPCLELIDKTYYPENNTSLTQITIITDDNQEVYNLWEKMYQLEELSALLSNHGFEVIRYYEDTTGKPFNKESEQLCIIAKKIS
jgi:2-polyprenyl-3-methyl-5-hydroxy-6-metoxy-1,4-benzoquinol methylase